MDAGAAAREYIRHYDGKTDTLAASLDRIRKTPPTSSRRCTRPKCSRTSHAALMMADRMALNLLSRAFRD
ncbi:MAG TPA: hypothetical protein PK093_05605 [Phycisphaerae bacterium]|nr:hypothetical protein [Phycisphaerae bacterium]